MKLERKNEKLFVNDIEIANNSSYGEDSKVILFMQILQEKKITDLTIRHYSYHYQQVYEHGFALCYREGNTIEKLTSNKPFSEDYKWDFDVKDSIESIRKLIDKFSKHIDDLLKNGVPDKIIEWEL